MDTSSIIRKTAADHRVSPNWLDFQAERQDFRWDDAERQLCGEAAGRINIAQLALDHPDRLKDKTAYRFLSRDTPARDMSYGELAADVNRFCNVLRGLDIRPVERVFVLADHIPELYVAMLGGLKNGNIVSPLLPALGPEQIVTRMNLGGGRVLVTTDALYDCKVAKWRDRMPTLQHVLLVAADGGTTAIPGTLDLDALMVSASAVAAATPTGAEDMALLHFTSGTTGTPKGTIHVHGAAASQWATGKYALDLHPDDIFWCTANPGWITCTTYGIIAPLLHGVTSIIVREELDAERWYSILQEQNVSVWHTAPTAIRMLMKAGAEIPKRYAFPNLRFITGVGDSLNAEAVHWSQDAFGLPIHDNWWQTETGGIMIADTPAFDIKPGSMGRPLPGIDAAIVRRREDGTVEVVEQPDVEGELALKRGWPSMFRAYLNNEERYRKCFAGDWYLTGDLAKRDADGYFWFVGRAASHSP